MHSHELELLIREYKNATTNEDKLILRKLESIANLCTDCKSHEFVFANEIAVEFCRIIKLLKSQYEEKMAEVTRDSIATIGYQSNVEYMPYQSDNELLDRFSDYLYAKYEATGKPSPSTIKDYVARINTFSGLYLWKIPRVVEIWERENAQTKQTPILFIYKHLEIILASFETKMDGEVNKQRSNIRSALSKLNEFKREQEIRH